MKIISAKNYSLRKDKFNLTTFFIKEKNNIFIRKKGNSNHVKKFLENFFIKRKLIEKELLGVKPVKILKKENNYIDFQYLDFPSFEYLIEKSLIERNFSKANEYFNIFLNLLNRQKILTKINSNDFSKFQSIFDPKKEIKIKEEKYLKIGIYDLNLDNFLYDQKRKEIYIVDWEWFFDFPIPLNLIIFRSIFYLSAHLQLIIQTFCNKEFPCFEILKDFYIPKIFWEKVDFSSNQIKNYLILENNFQNYVNKVKQKIDNQIFIEKYNLKEERILKNNINNFQTNQLSQQLQQKNQEIEEKNKQIKILKSKLKEIEQEKRKREEEERKKAEDLEKENQSIRQQIEQTKNHIQNLEATLNMIKSAKFFKLWQGYCRIMKSLGLKKDYKK